MSVLTAVLLCCFFWSILGACPNIDGCICNGDSELVIDCSGVSILSTLEGLRTAGVEPTVTQLSFVGPSEAFLDSDTFSGFVSLRELTIQFAAQLSHIQRGAFNTLSQLTLLDLRSNNLIWLSAETFIGIGTLLEEMRLDRNQLEHLRINLAPLFATLSEPITLENNNLDCNCHLQWLVDFISNATLPEVMDATCNGISITDSSVDFSECQDICELGFHYCNENATCLWSRETDQVTCTCNSGFGGDGFFCEPICESNLHGCHANASCSYNQITEQVTCTCNPGLAGSGSICEPICESNLHGCHANADSQFDENTTQVLCTCNPGFIGGGATCEPCNAVCTENMHCVIEEEGNTYCDCDTGYNLQRDTCVAVCDPPCEEEMCTVEDGVPICILRDEISDGLTDRQIAGISIGGTVYLLLGGTSAAVVLIYVWIRQKKPNKVKPVAHI